MEMCASVFVKKSKNIFENLDKQDAFGGQEKRQAWMKI
jgi:hypothetical protein